MGLPFIIIETKRKHMEDTMRLIQKRLSKTFLNILKYFLIIVFIIVIAFSNILYYSFEKTVLKKTYEINKKNLSLIGYNINYINEMVRTFCISQYYTSDNYKLITASERHDSDIEQVINDLRMSVSSNSQIHSAIIYNGRLKEYYSTFGREIYIRDEDLIKRIEEQKRIPFLSPVPRVLPKEPYKSSTKVFTYFMYDAIDKNSMIKGALIVNVKMNWLFETLTRLKSEDAYLIIVNRKGQVICDSSGNLGMFKPWNSEYAQKILVSRKLGNIFIQKINNKKRVITYLSIPNTGWIMINDEPYEKVFSHLIEIRNKFIIITLLFIFISALFSVFISIIVYKPFNNLVQMIKNRYNNHLIIQDTRDDIQYIHQAFELTSNKLTDFENLKQSVQGILKDNLLKSMLLESNFVENKVVEKYFEQFNNLFDGNSKFLMIVFKINNYNDYMKLNEFDRKLFKYGIQNIANEIITACCKVEIVDMGNDEIVAILGINNLDEKFDTIIIKKIKDIQYHVKNALNISISAFISRAITDFSQLSKYYREIKKIEKNKIFYDSPCILNIKTIQDHLLTEDFSYPYDIEKKLISELKGGNLEVVVEQYLKFIDLVSKNGFDNFMVSLMNLTVSIHRVINEINNNSTQDIDIDLFDFYVNVIKLDSIKQINEQYIKILKTIIKHKEVKKENKHSFIVNSIKDFIELNYYSKNLNSKQIAADFKMSKVYLGKIFKDSTQKSISQYINEVRLKKAAQLIASEKYSIREILDKIGFESESTFYKLFKKYYGVTPSQYRTSVNIKQVSENTNIF
ncbi:MAG: hypothetical protein PWQ70_346 [Clostridiales bacterium]|jgi:AraC-like DNA-binding protein|nr:hypothetical protein [Clostridiales bacterium]